MEEEGKVEQKLEKKFQLPKIRIDLKSLPQKIIHTLREFKRVIIVSKKPDIDELSEISKISGIGILVIGFIGFLLQTIFRFLIKWLKWEKFLL